MNKKIRSDLTDKLFRAILSMETIDECYLLFEDLCTVNEIQAIAQRMEVAAMLDAKCTYVEIAKNRCVYGNYQPRQPLSALWHRRVQAGYQTGKGAAGTEEYGNRRKVTHRRRNKPYNSLRGFAAREPLPPFSGKNRSSLVFFCVNKRPWGRCPLSPAREHTLPWPGAASHISYGWEKSLRYSKIYFPWKTQFSSAKFFAPLSPKKAGRVRGSVPRYQCF